MEKARVTVQYLKRLSPDHASAAEELLKKLPPGWTVAIPRQCRQPDESLSGPAIARALLFILDPEQFPACRRIALLARYISELIGMSQEFTQSHQPIGALK